AVGIDHPEVEDRAHLQRDVVPGDHILRRDVHRDRAQVDADRLLDARDHVDDPWPSRADEATQAEHHRTLVLAPDLQSAQHERPQDGQCGPCTKHRYSFWGPRVGRARVIFESRPRFAFPASECITGSVWPRATMSPRFNLPRGSPRTSTTD